MDLGSSSRSIQLAVALHDGQERPGHQAEVIAGQRLEALLQRRQRGCLIRRLLALHRPCDQWYKRCPRTENEPPPLATYMSTPRKAAMRVFWSTLVEMVVITLCMRDRML